MNGLKWWDELEESGPGLGYFPMGKNNVNEVKRLAEFAVSHPQVCFAAFTFGLKHRWTYFLRTLPDIDTLREPLERALAEVPSLIVIAPQQNGIF